MDDRQRIQQSMDYIEDNLKTNITVEELAQMAGFSLFHYYRLFHAAVGFPVMQYILRRRLLHGVYAMAQGSSGIQAALTYGFDTYAGFYKAFRREFGSTPASFLQQNRAIRPYRLNLFKEEHKMISRKTAAEILKYWHLETEEISDIYNPETGAKADNAVAVGNGYILKYTANLGKLKTHAQVSQATASAGLQVAALIPTLEGDAYVQDGELYFYLTRRLPGKRIPAKHLTKEDAQFVGEILAQLHLALSKVEVLVQEGNLLETVQSWALTRAAEILKLPASFCKEYSEILGELYPKLPRQLIHRDPNPGNILRWGDKWGFVDFELSEENIRIFDPCYAASAVLSESFQEVALDSWLEIYRSILLGYDCVGKLTEEERLAAPYVLLANQFVCVAWFSEDEKYNALLETNKRMTCWLLAHFEELKLD